MNIKPPAQRPQTRETDLNRLEQSRDYLSRLENLKQLLLQQNEKMDVIELQEPHKWNKIESIRINNSENLILVQEEIQKVEAQINRQSQEFVKRWGQEQGAKPTLRLVTDEE